MFVKANFFHYNNPNTPRIIEVSRGRVTVMRCPHCHLSAVSQPSSEIEGCVHRFMLSAQFSIPLPSVSLLAYGTLHDHPG